MKKNKKKTGDFDVRIGTKEEALWKRVEENTQQELNRLREAIQINEGILEMSQEKQLKEKIAQEEALF
jgi:calcineurin-like phosphoesterase